MKYRKFINNFYVSNICFGMWNLSPSTRNFKSPENLKKSFAIDLIKFAISKGINFFDTADIYGEGETEKMLGKIINSSSSVYEYNW